MIKSYSTVWFNIDCDFLSPSFATERGRDKQLERSTDRQADRHRQRDKETQRQSEEDRKTTKNDFFFFLGGG